MIVGADVFFGTPMDPQTTPTQIDINKDSGITITFADGKTFTYTLTSLRSMCPCARCKEERAGPQRKKSLLTVLPGNYANPMTIRHAELVGNYALKITWSDDHDTGFYSFTYLRTLQTG